MKRFCPMNSHRRSLDHRPRRRMRGAATLEFALAATLVLIPTLMAIFELAQLIVARHGLGFAATEVARAIEVAELAGDASRGDATMGDIAALRATAALALVPLFPKFDSSDVRNGGYAEGARSPFPPAPYQRAAAQAFRPDLLAINLESIGHAPAGETRFATVRVELVWCRETFFPPIGVLLARALLPSARDGFALGCLARDRVPLRVDAVAVPAAFVLPPTS